MMARPTHQQKPRHPFPASHPKPNPPPWARTTMLVRPVFPTPPPTPSAPPLAGKATLESRLQKANGHMLRLRRDITRGVTVDPLVGGRLACGRGTRSLCPIFRRFFFHGGSCHRQISYICVVIGGCWGVRGGWWWSWDGWVVRGGGDADLDATGDLPQLLAELTVEARLGRKPGGKH